jgi:hypothetical protein
VESVVLCASAFDSTGAWGYEIVKERLAVPTADDNTLSLADLSYLIAEIFQFGRCDFTALSCTFPPCPATLLEQAFRRLRPCLTEIVGHIFLMSCTMELWLILRVRNRRKLKQLARAWRVGLVRRSHTAHQRTVGRCGLSCRCGSSGRQDTLASITLSYCNVF